MPSEAVSTIAIWRAVPVILWVVGAIGCGPEVGRDTEVRLSERGETIRFSDASHVAGVAQHSATYAAAAADFDRDGWPDVAVSHHAGVRLLRNSGDGRFVDATSIGEFARGDTHGISWVDIDSDGWLDLYVSLGASRGFGRGANRLHANRYGQEFELVRDLPDVLADPLGRGRSSCPHDFDGDRVVDLAVVNAWQREREHRVAVLRGGKYEDRAEDFGLDEIHAEGVAVTWLGESGGEVIVAYGAGRDSGHLFRRRSGGRFEDVTQELGVAPSRFTVQAAETGDYDNDGDLDLYMVRGHGVPQEVRGVDGRVEYRLVAWKRGLRRWFRFRAQGSLQVEVLIAGNPRPAKVRFGSEKAAVSVLPWVGHTDDPTLVGEPAIDREADDGVFLWRDGGDLRLEFVGDGGRFRAAAGTISSPGGVELLEQFPQPTPVAPTPNILLENRSGQFVDVTPFAGVGEPGSGRDAVFADLDNDGDLDLYVVNGGTAFVNQPDVLYRNNGDGSFTDVTDAAGLAGPGLGRGDSALALDSDGDGDLDLFTTNGGGPPPGNGGPVQLWRNETKGGHWVEVGLVGNAGNTAAMGTRVTARFGGKVLAVGRSATTGRFSTSVLPLHIGLGEETEAELEVLWPSGRRQTASACADDRIVIREQ